MIKIMFYSHTFLSFCVVIFIKQSFHNKNYKNGKQ
jgi:hypothetical protein